MTSFIPSRTDLRRISAASFCALWFTGALATGALAQHGGGHASGAGHVSAPPAAHPASSRPVTPAPVRPPLTSPATHTSLVAPPINHWVPPFGTRVGSPFSPHPIFPHHPRFPFAPVPPRTFGVLGIPLFGLGLGWGFPAGPWLGCNYSWNWGYGCNGLTAFEYGPGYTAFPPVETPPQTQVEYQYWPVYIYGEPNSQYPELVLNDGTIYYVTDYWLVNGELHFKTVEEQGTKVVEHTIDFDQLDLQKTIDVNTDRGFRFVLRNEPLEQYMKDHPSLSSPDEEPGEEPAEPGPDEPQQASPQAPQPVQP